MKKLPYDEAFGRASDAFTQSVAKAVEAVQQEKPRRRMPRAGRVVCIAMAAVLLVGAAYAAIARVGLDDFFAGYYSTRVNDEGQPLLQSDRPLATFAVGEVTVRVTTAVADGRQVYLLAEFAARDEDVLLVGFAEGSTPSLPMDSEADRRLAVTLRMEVGGTPGHEFSFLRQEDGSLVGLNIGEYETDADTLEIRCEATVYEMEGFLQIDETSEQMGEATFTIPVAHERSVSRTTAAVPVPELGLVIDSLTLTRTPLTTYYTLEYSAAEDATPEQARAIESQLSFLFNDASGRMVGSGIGMYSRIETIDETHFVESASLTLPEMPDYLQLDIMMREDEMTTFFRSALPSHILLPLEAVD